jgi:CheY-like chemotaxis protein
MNLNGRRLLLVEDNELNAEIATELLERTGIAVEWADNGQTAVNRVAESAEDYYDIVFMDLQMPLMNGYEAVKAIRSMDRKDARTLPVIAVSANAFAEDIYAARKAGMNGHISKPLEPDAIAEVLREWVVK